MVALPKALDDDLLKSTGLTMSEYQVLMHLSEAAEREMRMTELAEATALSVSRISRVVNAMQTRGWVEKRRDAFDARGSVATLTTEGLGRLESAYPTNLASARNRVIKHLDKRSLSRLASQLEVIATQLD
ncbi:MarR family transcriptional regulator [Streptomyces sp. S.PB5]|uniref:MarR family winged helix-turn-helix transcriptional regulator n=1 Tax=Streptomyces sp. S.PB5 TaxID=3020844 RepID=UPI0025AF8EC1|nr:MarR family transcriptional regulator [Streptomyces sp. S.PB5]MDN3029301.1 MarR family transcriptional regulator [Streptomyces sp. S.PB5]